MVEDPEFDAVHATFKDSLWRVTAMYAHDTAAREDLFQEILVALWKALPAFRGQASVKTYVLRIAHNRGVSFRIRKGRQRAVEHPLVTPGPEPEDVTALPAVELPVEDRERTKRLRSAVQSLPAHLARTVTLRLEGLSAREVGEALGITQNNVEVRLTRARALLRELLDPEDFR